MTPQDQSETSAKSAASSGPKKGRLRIVLEMIKFEHSVFALPFALVGALLAARDAGRFPTFWQILWIIVAMVGARSAAMTMNRIADLEYDRRNPRTAMRALPTGELSIGFAWTFTLLASALLVIAAWQLNPLALKLSPVALAVLFFYSYTKRFTTWAHFVLGFCLGMSPAAAWIAIRGSLDWRMLILCAAVTLWVGGFDVLYACQDIEFDKAAGLYSIPKRFGVSGALVIARAMHIVMVGLLVWLARSFQLGWPAWAGIAVVATLLIYELSLGWLGNHVREKKHGNICYYNVNRHINPTNVCVAHCRLCAFGRSPDAPGAYTFALDVIYKRAAEGVAEGATEFHIVGGLHPDLPFEYYLELIRGLKQRFPEVHLKAFTMVEVGYYARISKLSIRDTLLAMKNAGVDSLPGGGAEIFHPRVRKVICDHKVSGQMWLQIAQTAHEVGLHSNATMLFGHVETLEERVDHLLRLRETQDKTHGFVTFIPLAFHPANTALSHLPGPTGIDDLKMVAVSRLMLDNFDHIKAYWVMLTPRIAQLALRFGADDLDGTVVEEKIYHDAGATTPEHLTRVELERLIRAAGRVPVERDTRYNPVDRVKMPFPPTAGAVQRRSDGFIPETSLTLNV